MNRKEIWDIEKYKEYFRKTKMRRSFYKRNLEEKYGKL